MRQIAFAFVSAAAVAAAGVVVVPPPPIYVVLISLAHIQMHVNMSACVQSVHMTLLLLLPKYFAISRLSSS